MLGEELSRVGVRCREVSEMVGVGEVPGCRGLPVSVKKHRRRGAALFCPSPPRFSATEGKGRAASGCCDSLRDDSKCGEVLRGMAELWEQGVLWHKDRVTSTAPSVP